MKSILNFFFGQKDEYIGLSPFKTTAKEKKQTKKENISPEKTSLTGMLKRVG